MPAKKQVINFDSDDDGDEPLFPVGKCFTPSECAKGKHREGCPEYKHPNAVTVKHGNLPEPTWAQQRKSRENSPLKRRHHEMRTLAQHSAKSVEHYTPSILVFKDGSPDFALLAAIRQLMGSIDCDPSSSFLAQKTVKAATWYGWDGQTLIDGLSKPWAGNVLLNAPGGRTSKLAPQLTSMHKTYSCVWWGRLITDWLMGAIEQAVFIGFTLEILQRCQMYGTAALPNPAQFPMCLVKERICFDYPENTLDGLPLADSEVVSGGSPTHGNFITWLPPTPKENRANYVDWYRQDPHVNMNAPRFRELFAPAGVCVNA